jgi:hypothetical protein
MPLKLLVIFTVASIVCQIIFSIYYSIAIVDQNTLINTRESNLEQLNIDNQQLEIKLSTLNSITNYLDITGNKAYTPVSSSINLN